MKREFKVYNIKTGKLEGIEFFIEKYEGHYEVLKDLYKRTGKIIELI